MMRRSIQFSFETGPAPPGVQMIGLGLVAFVTGLFALWTGFRAYDLEHSGVQTTGTVVALEQSDDVVYPVFSFTDSNGREHTARAKVSNDDYAVGDELRVLYRPGKPLDARLDAWWSLYFAPVLLCILSMAFLIGAAVFAKFKPQLEAGIKARGGRLVTTRVNPDGSVVSSTRSSVPLLTWTSRIFGFAAVVAVGAAGWGSWNSYEFARDGVETRGIVTGLVRVGASHRPSFQFTDSMGETRLVESSQTSNDYLVGDALRIIYLPDDPQTARIKSATVFFSLPAYFGALGLLFALIALVTRMQLRSITTNSD